MGATKITKDIASKMQKRRDQGDSITQIAKDFGVSRHTVYTYSRKKDDN